MKRIIIDCDPSNGIPGINVDDGLALALAIASPQIKLELVTTVSGNVPSDVGYCVAKTLMQRLGSSMQVVRGASRALLEPLAPWREKLTPLNREQSLYQLWNDVDSPFDFPLESPVAAQAIGDLVCANPGQITVVAIGPLTNIAHVIQLYPDFASSVAEIAIMGGTFNTPGYLKDTNFAMDPEAAHIVLNSGAKITLLPLDVTTQTQMLHHDLMRFEQIENELAHYVVETTKPWISFSMEVRKLAGCWIHDALVVAQLIDPTVIKKGEYFVDISLAQGVQRAGCRRWKPDTLRLDVGISPTQMNPITIAESVDNTKLLDILYKEIQKFSA